MLASVKNTFLHWTAEAAIPEVKTRSRSADTQPNGSVDDACAERLNQLLKVPERRRELLKPLGPSERLENASQDGEKSSSARAPSVEELRVLQRRIAEISGLPAESSGESLKKRILSSSSVSTMASEAEEIRPTKAGNMSKARSSGSVCSMCSDLFLEEGQIAPIMEEQGPSVASAKDGSKAEFTHNQVPKNVNLAAEFSKKRFQSPPTTMMIRNIPNRYTQREFIKELDDLGFAATYDFLYLPIDKGTLCNVGYAFVNFSEPHDAERCSEVFHNYVFQRYRKARGKIAAVSVAHLQGLEANLQHYQNSAVNMAPRIKQRGPLIIPRGTVASTIC
eukprot:symbB.v1.2.014230.t1/scaffold1035.1/size234022/6